MTLFQKILHRHYNTVVIENSFCNDLILGLYLIYCTIRNRYSSTVRRATNDEYTKYVYMCLHLFLSVCSTWWDPGPW